MTDDTSGDGADTASPESVAQAAAEFEAQGKPYARATVVRREAPVSANVGDRALVTAEGGLVGWIGGAECAQSVVVDRAREALADDEPVLVGLAPDPDDIDRSGVEAYPMTCHSGGTVEVFIEPVRPVPRLVVVGESPIASALVRLAGELSYAITVVTGPDNGDVSVAGADETVPATEATDLAGAIGGAEYVVVASMGEYDERSVAAGLLADASYVALVASDERRDEIANTVADYLGTEFRSVLEAITTPAGLDIGARTPEEIAVSVLAELVGLRRDADGPVPLDAADATGLGATAADADPSAETGPDDHDTETPAGETETVVDPVCGMEVTVGGAAATVEVGDETYHFCGQGCADAFRDDPDSYSARFSMASRSPSQ